MASRRLLDSLASFLLLFQDLGLKEADPGIVLMKGPGFGIFPEGLFQVSLAGQQASQLQAGGLVLRREGLHGPHLFRRRSEVAGVGEKLRVIVVKPMVPGVFLKRLFVGPARVVEGAGALAGAACIRPGLRRAFGVGGYGSTVG